MNPYPLLLLNHFTFPLATGLPPRPSAVPSIGATARAFVPNVRTKKIHKSNGSCGRITPARPIPEVRARARADLVIPQGEALVNYLFGSVARRVRRPGGCACARAAPAARRP